MCGAASGAVRAPFRPALRGTDAKRPATQPPARPIAAAPARSNGNGTLEEEDGHEGERRDRDLHASAQRAAADAQHRLDHHREHGGLRARRTAPSTHAHVVEAGVQRCSAASTTSAPGSTKSTPATSPPRAPMQQPADVGRELLRLGPGQQHAVVERVQEARLADPALLVDEHAVHQRDLTGRAAEAEQADLRPGAERLAPGDVRRRSIRCLVPTHAPPEERAPA